MSEPKTTPPRIDPPRSGSTSENIADTIDMVKQYALQETVGPLRTAGRWIALGLVGAVLIGAATGFIALGVVRMMQVEWPGTFGGRWTRLVPYLCGLVVCILAAVLAVRRINKDPLTKEKR